MTTILPRSQFEGGNVLAKGPGSMPHSVISVQAGTVRTPVNAVRPGGPLGESAIASLLG
jgi:hypothetical protein